jgi:hypothetical protein
LKVEMTGWTIESFPPTGPPSIPPKSDGGPPPDPLVIIGNKGYEKKYYGSTAKKPGRWRQWISVVGRAIFRREVRR